MFGVACVCPSVHCCTIGRGRCRGGQGSYRDSVIEEGKGDFPKVTTSHSSPNWLFLFAEWDGKWAGWGVGGVAGFVLFLLFETAFCNLTQSGLELTVTL